MRDRFLLLSSWYLEEESRDRDGVKITEESTRVRRVAAKEEERGREILNGYPRKISSLEVA